MVTLAQVSGDADVECVACGMRSGEKQERSFSHWFCQLR